MQHYLKSSFAKNIRYAAKIFNSEVKHTWISCLLKFKPTINYYLFFYLAYLNKKLLNCDCLSENWPSSHLPVFREIPF